LNTYDSPWYSLGLLLKASSSAYPPHSGLTEPPFPRSIRTPKPPSVFFLRHDRFVLWSRSPINPKSIDVKVLVCPPFPSLHGVSVLLLLFSQHLSFYAPFASSPSMYTIDLSEFEDWSDSVRGRFSFLCFKLHLHPPLPPLPEIRYRMLLSYENLLSQFENRATSQICFPFFSSLFDRGFSRRSFLSPPNPRRLLPHRRVGLFLAFPPLASNMKYTLLAFGPRYLAPPRLSSSPSDFYIFRFLLMTPSKYTRIDLSSSRALFLFPLSG